MRDDIQVCIQVNNKVNILTYQRKTFNQNTFNKKQKEQMTIRLLVITYTTYLIR